MSTSEPMSRGTDTTRPAYRDAAEVSPWVPGMALFAAVMMIITGIFGIFEGLAALFDNQIYVAGLRYVYAFDVTTWGWVHLILGILVLVAGIGVLSGRLWARLIGIAVASVSMLANFLFLPYYPFWAILIIAIDMFVIWALCLYNRDVADSARLGYD
jgi:hypothetical protein